MSDRGHTECRAARRDALVWLVAHLDHFAPPDLSIDESARKPLLELSLLTLYLLRESELAAEPSVSSIVDRLAYVARSATLRDRPIRTSSELVFRATLCGVLAMSGQPDALQDAAVQRAVDAGVLGQSEGLPHHVMIERTVLEWGGFRHTLPPSAELIRRSMLSRKPDALYQTEGTTYQLTHDVMFGSALATDSAIEFSWRDRDQLSRLLTDLIFRFRREKHRDLVGELVICWDCLGLEHNDAAYLSAWRSLIDAQDADGSVLAIENGEETAQEPKRFSQRYHSTLVFVMAATIHERRAQRLEPMTQSPLRSRYADSAADRIIRADAQWLTSLLQRDLSTRCVTVSLSALLGLTLLEARDASLTSVTDSAARRVAERLSDAVRLAQVPATLALTGYGILRNRGIHVSALTAFVELIASIAATPPDDAATELAWSEKRFLLGQLELITMPPLPDSATIWAAVNAAEQGESTRAWQLAGAFTGFGTHTGRDVTSSTRAAARQLESFAVESLRRTDLIGGCALTRSVHALAPLSPERVRSVTAFLHGQQLPVGGYGFLDEKPDLDFDPELDVRLPISLAVWWTLAEINTEFSLFKEIMRSEIRR